MNYIVTLKAEPGNWRAPIERRLSLALKVLLRSFGLRCTMIREEQATNPIEGPKEVLRNEKDTVGLRTWDTPLVATPDVAAQQHFSQA